MAYGRGLIVVCIVGVAATAWAGGACDEGRESTGLGIGVRDGAVAVTDVLRDSAAGRSGLRTGDVIQQVNDVLPRNCSEWARAVRHARDDGKALLVLVRRGGVEVPLVLGASTWARPEVARGGAEPRSDRGEPAPRDVPAAPPVEPLPPETAVSAQGVVRDLGALAPLDRPPANLLEYQASLTQVRRQIETLATRGGVQPDVVADLRGVARYYEGAGMAWEAIEGDRAESRLSRRLPVAENMTVPFFSNSPVGTLLDEFDFLNGTIARQPRGGRLAEASGLWRPVWARLLLWERGAQALDDLRARRGL